MVQCLQSTRLILLTAYPYPRWSHKSLHAAPVSLTSPPKNHYKRGSMGKIPIRNPIKNWSKRRFAPHSNHQLLFEHILNSIHYLISPENMSLTMTIRTYPDREKIVNSIDRVPNIPYPQWLHQIPISQQPIPSTPFQGQCPIQDLQGLSQEERYQIKWQKFDLCSFASSKKIF